jgi:hypothetical protein
MIYRAFCYIILEEEPPAARHKKSISPLAPAPLLSHLVYRCKLQKLRRPTARTSIWRRAEITAFPKQESVLSKRKRGIIKFICKYSYRNIGKALGWHPSFEHGSCDPFFVKNVDEKSLLFEINLVIAGGSATSAIPDATSGQYFPGNYLCVFIPDIWEMLTTN